MSPQSEVSHVCYGIELTFDRIHRSVAVLRCVRLVSYNESEIWSENGGKEIRSGLVDYTFLLSSCRVLPRGECGESGASAWGQFNLLERASHVAATCDVTRLTQQNPRLVIRCHNSQHSLGCYRYVTEVVGEAIDRTYDHNTGGVVLSGTTQD